MSANDSRSFGEVTSDSSADSSNFVSPNITSAAEEEQRAQEQAAAAQKQAETVNIDGVPIADQDIQYKTRDIVARKADAKYFVNIKEEEEAAKAQAHQAKAAQRKTNWRRFGRPILVVVIILILAVGGGFTAKYFLDQQGEEAETSVYEKIEEIDKLSDVSSEASINNTTKAYEDAIANTSNKTERHIIEARYVEFLAYRAGLYEEAIAKLDKYSKEYNDSELCEVISVYFGSYHALGDEENISKYEEIDAQKCSSGDGDGNGRG